jgi:50S ribosomal protein L16 3-hydroxylase
LASLIAPMSTRDFLREVWGKQWLFVREPEGEAEALAARLTNSSIRELLRMSRGQVIVMHATADGEYRGTKVAATEAFEFYESNLPLYFDLADSVPQVAAWVNALARDLQLPRANVRVSVFASPVGGKTECHFDSNENFTIQLRGSKRWRMAPNTSVRDPVDRFTASHHKSPIMALCYEEEFRSEPPLFEVADLVPGSMLYVPRGYWHDVEAIDTARSEASLSLNLCIKQEYWLAYLLPLIERRLVAEPAWREAASGVRGTPAEREAAHQRVRQLLAGLSDTLGQLTRDETVPDAYTDALSATGQINTDTTFRRSRTAVLLWSIDRTMSSGRLTVQVENANDASAWSAPASMSAVCSWICSQTRFDAGTVLARFADLPTTDILQLLHRLVASRLLYVG